LYLYIYIAFLAVAAHTNQKRFQCARHREKKAVLRLRIGHLGLGSPVNKVDRILSATRLSILDVFYGLKNVCLGVNGNRAGPD